MSPRGAAVGFAILCGLTFATLAIPWIYEISQTGLRTACLLIFIVVFGLVMGWAWVLYSRR